MADLNSKHLVIGLGEVGTAVLKILQEKFDAVGIDKKGEYFGEKFDVLHICFPYSVEFEASVKVSMDEWLKIGGLTIIHSTIPIGTSEKFGIVHSPIRGMHPNLYEGIKTFVKFFGGRRAEEAAQIFRECGVICETTESSRNTEAFKLWDTTQYGLMIILEKEIHSFCEKNNLDFNIIYKRGNETYNEGYVKLGLQKVIRPILEHQEGKIGGHCVVENCNFLKDKIAEWIVQFNNNLL